MLRYLTVKVEQLPSEQSAMMRARDRDDRRREFGDDRGFGGDRPRFGDRERSSRFGDDRPRRDRDDRPRDAAPAAPAEGAA